MGLNNYKKYILITLLFGLFIFSLVSAQNFIGPSCTAGQCQGKIGVDSNSNISIGTSTPQSNTKVYVVGSTSDSSAYGLRIISSNSSPVLWVRNDGKVSIATTSFTYALNVAGDIYASGNLLTGGSFSAALSAGNVTPGVFNSLQGGGTGAYAFLGSLGIATTSQVGLPQALSVYGGGYFSDNVGIGTTGPAYKLDVQGGQINSSGGLCIAGDCKTAWSQVGGSSQWTTTSTGIYYSGGNVGIGNVPSASLPLNIETNNTAYTGIGLVNTDVSSRTWSIFSNSNSTTFGPSKGFGIRDITAGATRLVIDTNGNVGIGTTAPAYTLDVNGNIRIRDNYNLIVNSTYGKIEITTGVGYPGVKISTGYPTGGTIEFGYPQSGGVYDAKIYRSGSSQLRASSSLIIDGSLGIGTTTPAYKLDVVSAGSVTARFGTASTDQVIIGGGAGKLNVGTVDPPYTINGKKYATYVSAMTGQKEETTGIIKVKNSECQIKNNSKICESKINFNLEPEGSDLWLFSKVTNLKNNFNKMAVILSGDFKGRLWYNKNNNLVLSIYFEPEEEKENYEISYRLTAPRFDADKFLNERNNSDPNEPEGLIINE